MKGCFWRSSYVLLDNFSKKDKRPFYLRLCKTHEMGRQFQIAQFIYFHYFGTKLDTSRPDLRILVNEKELPWSLLSLLNEICNFHFCYQNNNFYGAALIVLT